MPPKKTAAATKSAPKTKTVKRKTDKENPETDVNDEVEEEVPEKKVKARAAKKEKAPIEERPKLTRKAQTKAVVEETVDVQQKKTRTAKVAGTKKEVADEDEAKNGTIKKKVNKSKKAKDDESETVSEKKETATKTKKKAAPKEKATAAKGKKANQPEAEEVSEPESDEAQEKAAETASKGRMRKTAPKKDSSEIKTVKNITATDWQSINFNCSSKNSKGNLPNLHITSWNVDGLRAWLKKGGLNIIDHDKPDIFCVQETKCSSEKLPDEIMKLDGYVTYWASSQKEGYAGVGVASKVKPISTKFGIDSTKFDSEGRCITLEYNQFYLINVYVPNAGRKLVTLEKRLEWNKLFSEYVKKLDDIKPVIICGDMNVAHNEIDLANPKTNTKNAGFTPEEREGMTEFLGAGYVDTFRKLYPDQANAYTFWTYMSGARAKNVGWRLDYFIVSERIMEDICDNVIHSNVFGSDHCPLSLYLNL